MAMPDAHHQCTCNCCTEAPVLQLNILKALPLKKAGKDTCGCGSCL